MSATFKALKRMRILIDGGGNKMVDGIMKKMPARWVDFSRNPQITLFKEKDIQVLRASPNNGIDFVELPELKKKVGRDVKET